MDSPFDKTSTVFANAATFRVNKHPIKKFDPVRKLAEIVRRVLSTLTLQESDEDASLTGFAFWNLQCVISGALLPFSHTELGLRSRANDLRQRTYRFPALHSLASEAVDTVEYLIENPLNPKGDVVRTLISDLKCQGCSVGLVMKLNRGNWHECSPATVQEFKQASFIVSRSDLYRCNFDAIVLPSGGKYCPLQRELLQGFHSARLDMVYYSGEVIAKEWNPNMPQTSYFLSCGNLTGVTESTVIEEDLYTPSDDLFWEYMRNHAKSEATLLVEHPADEATVKARLILLAGGNSVWLSEDKKILTVSPGKGNADESLAYRSIQSLLEGDYIVLRTLGGGDMIKEIADAELARDGKELMREHALDWKGKLRSTIEANGIDAIARDLNRRGVNLSSTEYIWLWTTDVVMRPRTVERFRVLIQTLKDRDAYPGGIVEDIVSSRWRMMNEIDHYHMKAGFSIRRELLSALTEKLRQGGIEDQMRLTIPQLGSAEMSLFLVTGVDSVNEFIPSKRIGTILRSVEP